LLALIHSPFGTFWMAHSDCALKPCVHNQDNKMDLQDISFLKVDWKFK